MPLFEEACNHIDDISWFRNSENEPTENGKEAEKILINSGEPADPFFKHPGYENKTILHIAAESTKVGSAEVLEWILDKAKEVNVRHKVEDKEGKTPLGLLQNQLNLAYSDNNQDQQQSPSAENQLNHQQISELEKKKELLIDYGGIDPQTFTTEAQVNELASQVAKSVLIKNIPNDELNKWKRGKENSKLINEAAKAGGWIVDNELKQVYLNFYHNLFSKLDATIMAIKVLSTDYVKREESNVEKGIKASLGLIKLPVPAGDVVKDVITSVLFTIYEEKKSQFFETVSKKFSEPQETSQTIADYCTRITYFLRDAIIEEAYEDKELLDKLNSGINGVKNKIENQYEKLQNRVSGYRASNSTVGGYQNHWDRLISKYIKSFIQYAGDEEITPAYGHNKPGIKYNSLGEEIADYVAPLFSRGFNLSEVSSLHANKITQTNLKPIMLLNRALEENSFQVATLICRWGYGSENSIFIETENGKFAIIENEEKAIIAIKETTNAWKNLKNTQFSNASIEVQNPNSTDSTTCKVFGRLKQQTDKIWEEINDQYGEKIRNLVNSRKQVILTGYGLGGAFASIMGLYFLNEGAYPNNTEIYAISPNKWLANAESQKENIARLLPHLYKIYDYRDYKSSKWPSGKNYIDGGNKYYIVNGKLVKGEDYDKWRELDKQNASEDREIKDNIINLSLHSFDGINEYFWQIENLRRDTVYNYEELAQEYNELAAASTTLESKVRSSSEQYDSIAEAADSQNMNISEADEEELFNRITQGVTSFPVFEQLKNKFTSSLENLSKNKKKKILKLLPKFDHPATLLKTKSLFTSSTEAEQRKGLTKERGYFSRIISQINELKINEVEINNNLDEENPHELATKTLFAKIHEYYDWYLDRLIDYHRGNTNTVSGFNDIINKIKNKEISAFPEENIILKTINEEQFHLNEEAKEKLTIEKPIKTQAYGKHTVIELDGVYYKYKPYAPGLEYAINNLSNKLGSTITPPTSLLKLVDTEAEQTDITQASTRETTPRDENTESKQSGMETKEYTEPQGLGRYKVFYNASLAVNGCNLHDLLENYPELIETKLDETNFAWMFILGVLTNPSDAKPDNFKAELIKEKGEVKKIKIIGVDNDISFSKGVIRQHGEERQGKIYSDILNVLYFFPQMNKVIPQEVIEKLREPNFVEKTLVSWISDLYKANKEYQSLKENNICDEDELKLLKLPISFPAGTLEDIYDKAKKLVKIAEREKYITPDYIFTEFYPGVSAFYRAKREQYRGYTDKILSLYKDAAESEELAQAMEESLSSNSRVQKLSMLKTSSKSKMLTPINYQKVFNSSVTSEAEALVSNIDLSAFKKDNSIYHTLEDFNFLEQLNLNKLPKESVANAITLINKINPSKIILTNPGGVECSLEDITEIIEKINPHEVKLSEITHKETLETRFKNITFTDLTPKFTEFVDWGKIEEKLGLSPENSMLKLEQQLIIKANSQSHELELNAVNFSQYLRKHKLNINEKDEHGETVLHHLVKASRDINAESLQLLIQLLLDCGINEDVPNSEGKTAVKIAEENELYNISQLLNEHIPELFWEILKKFQKSNPHYLQANLIYYIQHCSKTKLARLVQKQIGDHEPLIDILVSNSNNSKILEELLARTDIDSSIISSGEGKYNIINQVVGNLNSVEILNKLLTKFPNLNIEVDALDKAKEQKNYDIIACLLYHGGKFPSEKVQIISENPQKTELSLKAVKLGMEIKGEDLKEGYHLERTNLDGNNLLHLIAKYEDSEDILEFYSNIDIEGYENFITNYYNTPNRLGKTPIDLAIEHKNYKLIEAIHEVREKFEPNYKPYNENFEHIYAQNDIIKELSKIFIKYGYACTIEEAMYGIKLDKVDESGNTILYTLIKEYYKNIQDNNSQECKTKYKEINSLLEAGANPNYTERKDGFTPLHLAARYGLVGITKKLSNLRGDLRVIDSYNRTPLDIVISELKKSGNDISKTTYENLYETLLLEYKEGKEYFHNSNNILYDSIIRGQSTTYDKLLNEFSSCRNYLCLTPEQFYDTCKNIGKKEVFKVEEKDFSKLLELNDLVNLKLYFSERIALSISKEALLYKLREVLLTDYIENPVYKISKGFSNDKKFILLQFIYYKYSEIFSVYGEELLKLVLEEQKEPILCQELLKYCKKQIIADYNNEEDDKLIHEEKANKLIREGYYQEESNLYDLLSHNNIAFMKHYFYKNKGEDADKLLAEIKEVLDYQEDKNNDKIIDNQIKFIKFLKNDMPEVLRINGKKLLDYTLEQNNLQLSFELSDSLEEVDVSIDEYRPRLRELKIAKETGENTPKEFKEEEKTNYEGNFDINNIENNENDSTLLQENESNIDNTAPGQHENYSTLGENLEFHHHDLPES